jgi:hypothetical protein
MHAPSLTKQSERELSLDKVQEVARNGHAGRVVVRLSSLCPDVSFGGPFGLRELSWALSFKEWRAVDNQKMATSPPSKKKSLPDNRVVQ